MLSGKHYWKFDPKELTVLAGYPRSIGQDFFGCAAHQAIHPFFIWPTDWLNRSEVLGILWSFCCVRYRVCVSLKFSSYFIHIYLEVLHKSTAFRQTWKTFMFYPRATTRNVNKNSKTREVWWRFLKLHVSINHTLTWKTCSCIKCVVKYAAIV